MNPAAENKIFPGKSNEKFYVSLLLLGFFLANLLVATHTPTVSVDEPGYTDPAANLYFGKGFTSTMWAQGAKEFWCGNVPLYQAILFVTFKLFGFGLLQARLVNTVLFLTGTLMIWAALRWSNIIPAAGGRLLALALMLSGSVITLTVRTIRPDTTMFFICATVFFCSQLPLRFGVRCFLAGFTAILLPFAGVPMLPYPVLLSLCVVACLGWADFALLASVGAGLISGIFLLLLFYHHFSSIKNFIEIILPFTAIGGARGGGLYARIVGNAPGDDNLFTSFFGNPLSFTDQKTLFDYSAALLFVLFVAAAISLWPVVKLPDRRKILFVLILTLMVPPLMHMMGHYRSMYRWMTYIPLTIAIPWILNLKARLDRPAPPRWLVLPVIGGALLLGIPARTLLAARDWSARSMAPLEHASAAVVQSNDVVVCSLKTWFAIRPRAQLVYCSDLPARGVLPQTVNFPTNEVSLLCLATRDYTNVTSFLGGQWKKIPEVEIPDAGALAKSRYSVEFYRRFSDPSTSRTP